MQSWRTVLSETQIEDESPVSNIDNDIRGRFKPQILPIFILVRIMYIMLN